MNIFLLKDDHDNKEKVKKANLDYKEMWPFQRLMRKKYFYIRNPGMKIEEWNYYPFTKKND